MKNLIKKVFTKNNITIALAVIGAVIEKLAELYFTQKEIDEKVAAALEKKEN